jgi:hypothetical protein
MIRHFIGVFYTSIILGLINDQRAQPELENLLTRRIENGDNLIKV